MSKNNNILNNIKINFITKIAYFVLNISEKSILRERMVSMMQLMQNDGNSSDVNNILENMGRKCCDKYKMSDSAKKHRGNPQYFLDNITKFTIWDESADYDFKNGIIKIVGIKRKACVCPFARLIKSHVVICDTCCVGFQKELFETLLNKSVRVCVDESLLMGNNRCSFTIRFTNKDI